MMNIAESAAVINVRGKLFHIREILTQEEDQRCIELRGEYGVTASCLIDHREHPMGHVPFERIDMLAAEIEERVHEMKKPVPGEVMEKRIFGEPHKLPEPDELPGQGSCVGYLEAWRLWGVGHDGMLKALVANYAWPPKRAARAVESRPYPGTLERCLGIYACTEDNKELEDVDLPQSFNKVLGKVALWGTIYIHERGYRAQYAYPLSLHYWTGEQYRIIRAAEKYGIPLKPTEIPEVVYDHRKTLGEENNLPCQYQANYQHSLFSTPSWASTGRPKSLGPEPRAVGLFGIVGGTLTTWWSP